MASVRSGGGINSVGKQAVFADDDYMPLERLSVALTRGSTHEEGTFTLCFWIYIMRSTTLGVVIRQGRPHAHAALPFLTIDVDRKLTLHPLPPPPGAQPGLDSSKVDLANVLVVSEQPCPLEKWVNIGCEVGPDIARLHMDGSMVGQRHVSFPPQLGGVGGDAGPVLLSGGDGSASGGSVQAYAHYVRLLSRPNVTNHYVKNPPLELALDGNAGADDNELEEGGDGVWSVVGGKASCRRNFALDVALLDALGRSAHRDMEIVASLVYADDGVAVQRSRDDAESPLLTTFDGVEFPSTERPVKLVHGRASFKLKISMLSSKCDNRLFRVCFDPLHAPRYPFLRALSRPIRCVSRNRNHRPASSKRPAAQLPPFSPDGTSPPVDIDAPPLPLHPLLHNVPSHSESTPRYSLPAHQDAYGSGSFDHLLSAAPMANPSSSGGEGSGIPPSNASNKRARTNGDDTSSFEPIGGFLPAVSESPNAAAQRHQQQQLHGQLAAIQQASLQDVSPSAGYPTYAAVGPGGSSVDPAALAAASLFLGGTPGRLMASPGPSSLPGWHLPGGTDTLQASSAMSAARAMAEAARAAGPDSDIPDRVVFQYCLETMAARAVFLRSVVIHKSDEHMARFAARVAQCTGCKHNGYQIAIAKRLLHDLQEVWRLASSQAFPVLWSRLADLVEERFQEASGCRQREFSAKDREFMQRIAGCGEFITLDEFERLWMWLYPVALTLTVPQLRCAWESKEPLWIHGMISRAQADALLSPPDPKSPTGKPGTFLLRFASSRIWPHPDAGALVVSYVGSDHQIFHKLLTVDDSPGLLADEMVDTGQPLADLLLSQPELSELCSPPQSPQKNLQEHAPQGGGLGADRPKQDQQQYQVALAAGS